MLFRVFLTSSLLALFSTTYFAQIKGVKSVLDHTSNIVVNATAEGTTISYTYNSNSKSNFAGVISGTLNGTTTVKFYCIDLLHDVNPGNHPTYWDQGSTPAEMTYILNNYFPFNTSNYTGKLSDINKEAASIQTAIWHFSDGVDANTITDATIKNRTLSIIADASANSSNTIPLETLIIVPASQSFTQGTPALFNVYALDTNGNPVTGLSVALSTTLGNLSAVSGTTDGNGKLGPISLTYSATGTAVITAQATVQISQGTVYVDKTDPTGKQRLVLASPTTDKKEVNATVTWYTPSGNCDTQGFTTFTQGGWGSPSNSAPGAIRDQNFSTVFPSNLVVGGTFKLTLTSASAVKNYLPDGGTAAAYTQNYNNPTSHINVLSGQLVALKLNVAYSAAGKLGSNITKLGDLVIASGPFIGKTVNQFLALAETAIGGGSLNGFTLTQYNDAATSINENFDGGTCDKGFLSCANNVCKDKIGGILYRDKNANGTKDSGEPGIAGVIIELVQGTTVISKDTTDANGNYLFSNLTNGTYTVRIASSNFTTGGAFFNTDQVKWYTKGSTTANTTLSCNDNLSINFGYYKTCVGITKTADKTTYKPGDVVTYTIIVENCGDIQLHGGVDVTDTMLFGSTPYHIDLIDPGQTVTIPVAQTKYTVKSTDCGNLVNSVRADGHPVDGSATVTASTSVTVTVDCTVCKNTIGSYVYRDLNVNGTKDSGEPGIAGVIVELVQGSSVSSTTTDVNGYYSFTNVLNGTYTVRIAASNFLTGGAFFNTDQTKWYTKNSSSVNTTLNCNDNLSINFGYYKTCVNITKSADKSSYNSGETITYSFLVENCGDIQLHGGIDIFDAMLNSSGNNLIKHIDVLDPHQSTTFTMTYLTSNSNCGQLTNTVRAEGHPVDGSATVIDNSTWTVNVVCQDKADIKVEKTVDNSTPTCNSNVTFTIKVTNLGPNTAKSVEVTDMLPSGLIYVSNSASQGTYNNTTGIWTVGNLSNNAYATLTITVKVDCGQVNSSVFDLGAAKDYNLFVIEDATQPSADTQGKVAVGRDAKFSTYSIGDQLPSGSGDVLIVGRDLTYTSGAIYNGNVVYGHSTNLPISAVSITGGSLRKDTPINFAAAKVALQSLSSTLSAYTVNGTTAFQWGGLTLTGSDPYLNVFSVNGSNLSSANNVEIDVPNGSAVLVNISGTTLTWTGGLVVNGTAITNVLYNFYQASSITIQGINVTGSILAPFAAVNFVSGVQNGQMICLSLTGMGQFNYSPFGGYIPCDKKITNVALVSSCLTADPNPGNNSSSATVTVNSTGNNGGGNNGGGNNNGGSWSNVSSFGAGEIVYSLAYGSNGIIYAGTMGGKIYKSTDNGTTWTVINAGMNVSFIWSLNISGGYIFAATEQGVYKYSGTTWTLTTLSGKDVHSLASYNGTVYAATWGFGIYKSSDNGSSWTQINNGLGSFLAIQALTITSNGNVFAGTAGGGVFKCSDGVNWTKLTCSYSVIWSMASTSTAVFAGTYGDGLYRSLDAGLSWTKTSLNISFVYSITVNLSGKIYVSSLTNGVYTSTDNGTTWNSIGMDGYGVSSLLVSTTSNNVYVGTKEGKVFMSSNNGTTAIENNNALPTEFKLEQNYPNPFNPSTTIQFAVPQAGKYSLKVYNVLGQEVAELMNKDLSAGVHKVNFDATRMASGMYIYRLNGSNVNMTKKMILMK